MAFRSRVALLGVALLAALGAAQLAPAQPAARAPYAVSKTCSAGYTHAVIGGAEKCLRAGEFCAHRYDSQYRRYGFRCIRYDARVQRYRLTRR
ncbi:MAG TPA: hypothetical protein VF101_07960 [Gaiellaceae bacterium]